MDVSSEGIGAVVPQDGKSVAYRSFALTDSEQRNAQIKKELLAIVYGWIKFHQYENGKEIPSESNHKFLELYL